MQHVARRSLEIWTAAACALFGGVVLVESLGHDVGWNETGPGSGYFPFRVGLLTIGASAALLVGVAFRGRGRPSDEIFVTRAEFARTLSVFLPTAALAAGMLVLGCYVPSAVYLAWMMRRHGGRRWPLSAAFGAAVMVAFFLVFDVWFRVPLANGPVEAAFGVY